MADQAKRGRLKVTPVGAVAGDGPHSRHTLLGKPKKTAKARSASEHSQKGSKQQEVKSPKEESTDMEMADDVRFQLRLKEEADDEDFVTGKAAIDRKRKREPTDGLSSSTILSLHKKKKVTPEWDGETGVGKKKRKTDRKEKNVVKEEGTHHPIPTKKWTREQVEASKALKIKKQEEEEQQRWRWWEEDKYEDGIKWKFLEHKGPYFPPKYQPLPHDVKLYYDGTMPSSGSA